MDITERQALIEKGIRKDRPGQWADLGCGEGAFTYALVALLAPGSHIWAIDQNPQRLTSPRADIAVSFRQGDMETFSPSSSLAGILMANSLHYVQEKGRLILKWVESLEEEGRLVIVEYDSMRSNPWIPYPISFAALTNLSLQLGLGEPEKLKEQPSRFGGQLYSALISI